MVPFWKAALEGLPYRKHSAGKITALRQPKAVLRQGPFCQLLGAAAGHSLGSGPKPQKEQQRRGKHHRPHWFYSQCPPSGAPAHLLSLPFCGGNCRLIPKSIA